MARAKQSEPVLRMHLLGTKEAHLKMQVYCSSQVGFVGGRDAFRLLGRPRRGE